MDMLTATSEFSLRQHFLQPQSTRLYAVRTSERFVPAKGDKNGCVFKTIIRVIFLPQTNLILSSSVSNNHNYNNYKIPKFLLRKI